MKRHLKYILVIQERRTAELGGELDPFLSKCTHEQNQILSELYYCYVGVLFLLFFMLVVLMNCMTINLMMRYKPQC